jgi:hypothetical protein
MEKKSNPKKFKIKIKIAARSCLHDKKNVLFGPYQHHQRLESYKN